MRRVVLCTSKEYAATETARLGDILKHIANQTQMDKRKDRLGYRSKMA